MAGPPEIQLDESDSVVLDVNGNGLVRLVPYGSKEYWTLATAAVKCNTHVVEAQCVIYVGPVVSDANIADATFTGSSGNASGKVAGRIIGRNRDPYVWAVWTGGDPGATATLSVQGTKQIRG